MALVSSVGVQAVNTHGRPIRFLVTDAKNTRYSLSGEELRWAVNTDAEADPVKADPVKSAAPRTLKSSFVKVISDSDEIRFVDGHGWGHGVGFCQWCSQRRAEEGLRHEDIVLAAFPRAKLVRAY